MSSQFCEDTSRNYDPTMREDLLDAESTGLDVIFVIFGMPSSSSGHNPHEVRTPGNVSTMVFLSYFLSGTSLPFSSGMRMPCGDGFSPRPTQNFASATTQYFAEPALTKLHQSATVQ